MNKEFYYQIKGKKDINQYHGSGFSDNWVFPPIFSGKVSAIDNNEAKKFIEEEYNKKFPLRVLKKDIDNNELLLKITEIKDGDYNSRLFDDINCPVCNKIFKTIDLYNDANNKCKSGFCSDECKEIKYNQERAERFENYEGFSDSPPVIYKITNKVTGKCYIGQTIRSFTLRWWEHLKWGKTDSKFYKAINESKLTDWIFEVIEVVANANDLNDRESFFINFYNSVENGYNTVKVK